MKNIQKQYERRIKVNQNKDTFITYQRYSQHDYSPILQSRQNASQKNRLEEEHSRIECMKETLKSMSQQASIDFYKASSKQADDSHHSRQQDDHQSKKYNIKLDQLSKNLEELACKGHFSPAAGLRQRSSTASQVNPNQSLRREEQKGPTISLQKYELQTQQCLGNQSNNLLFPASKSQSLIKKDDSNNNSKNHSQNKSSQMESVAKESVKLALESPWPSKNIKSTSKKSFSKKDIVAEPLMSQNSKNLTRIFENMEEAIDYPRMRERAETQTKQSQAVFNSTIHRSSITSLLVSDAIYTSSLDYTVRRSYEAEGEYQSHCVAKFRGGIEFIAPVNGKIYGSGRDCYIRSLDGHFHHKFESAPLKFYESDRSNLLSIGLRSNKILQFDLQKGVEMGTMLASCGSHLMGKISKEVYIGDKRRLGLVDWRKKNAYVEIYRTPKQVQTWLSCPLNVQFAFVSQGEIVTLNEKLQKSHCLKLSSSEVYRAHDWGRTGLNLAIFNSTTEATKLTRFKGQAQKQEVDLEPEGSWIAHLALRQRQIIYGGLNGQLLVKRSKF